MPHHIYFDCDNTMGLPGCDMDDGMTLLYLLGREDIQVEAVTTSFGNNCIEQVHPNTERMFRELGLEHIPLKKGAASVTQRRSEASHFLATEIPKHQERVTLLITGSPTNIYAACQENADLLDNVQEMVCMGGITEPLIIGGRQMPELNFASDPEATHYLLNCPVNKTIASAQLCLEAWFDQAKMDALLRHQEVPAFAYLKEPLKLWYDFISAKYGVPGFHAWDLVAAVYITYPELFDRHEVCVSSTIADLRSGLLRVDPHSAVNSVNLPTTIHDRGRFWQVVFEAWQNVAS